MSAEPRQIATQTQNSDSKFWLAFEHANVGMALLLPNGRFQRANPELCKILGYSEQELKEVDVQTITYPDDLDDELHLLMGALEEKPSSYQIDKRFMRQDGTIIVASVSATLDYDRAGRPLHFIYMVNALPELPATAPAPPTSQENLESEDRLFQFLEAVPMSLFVIDGAGMAYYANKPAQELLGIGITPEAPDDPLAGLHALHITGTDDPYPEERIPLARALAGESTTVEDMEVKWPGHAVPVQSWASPIYGTNGEILFAVTAFSDVTERRAAQDELLLANDRYMAICDNVNELISMHDLKGIYRFASPACARLTGYEPQELVGTDARLYIHPDDLPLVAKTFQRYAAGSDEHMRATYRVRRKDGEYTWVETGARPILGTYGARREILFVTRDLAEGKDMQASLLEEKRLLEEQEQEMQRRALLDPLTGVKNRSALEAYLEQMLTSRRAATYPFGCLLLDVDRYETIYAKYGESVAEEILKKVAKIITNACRTEDFIGRLSDNQFMVLLPTTDAAGTVVVGEKLISNVRTAYWADTPVTENITISVGGSCITRYTGLTQGELFEMLNDQLREAQEGGHNRMVMNARRAVSGQWAALSGR
ncbi:MAG TPA: PAS domain S-box protein [Chloroflexia bacterium]|nr:PAS domain S-box protein [Chloroflexia bacterium]